VTVTIALSCASQVCTVTVLSTGEKCSALFNTLDSARLNCTDSLGRRVASRESQDNLDPGFGKPVFDQLDAILDAGVKVKSFPAVASGL